MSKRITAHHSKVVGKPAAHHKTAAPSTSKLQKEIVALQHAVASLKHHHPAAKKSKAKKSRKHVKHVTLRRGLALGDAVVCCSAEALAASLRLTGHRVSDDDVLALHYAAGGTGTTAVSIQDVLTAAAIHGLAGVRPAECGRYLLRRGGENDLTAPDLADDGADGSGVLAAGPFLPLWIVDEGQGDGAEQRVHDRSLILGVTLPGGPHALTADPSGAVWSWGELYDPAELDAGPAEEAWAVTWR